MAWTKEQQLAIDIQNNNVIVSAGAGSGKTAVLTTRVLRKLKEGVSVDKLLILTFTNAAAKEMKERIKKGIMKEPDLKDQLAIIDAAYITTFDSFAMAMVKKYHYILNISPNLKVIDEALLNIQKEKILDSIFDEKYAQNDEAFLTLIGDLCVKDDNVIKKYLLNIDKKLELNINKEYYLNNYIDNYFYDKKIDNDINLFTNILREKILYIKTLINDLLYVADYKVVEAINSDLHDLLNANTYNEIKKYASVKLTRLPSKSSDEAKQIKEMIKKMCDDILELSRYEDEASIKESINKTRIYQEVIIDILKRLNEETTAFKYQNDMYEFQDIAKFLIKLLKGNDDILEELKNTFDEIMIDEYQDTNDIQEEFVSLIQNKNIYMVGDIKQSIYRFRNANPNIFMDKYELYKDGFHGVKIDLNKNFRSREEVLSDINLIFNQVMNMNYGGADYLKQHQMIFGNEKYLNEDLKENHHMEIYNYQYDKSSNFKKDELEAFIIANDIKNKVKDGYLVYDKDNDIKRKIEYSDFAILVDKSKSFMLYKKIFEYLNVPLTVFKDNNISDDIVLVLLKNTLGFINKIYNKEYDDLFKYYFISLMRSPLFEESDDVIFKTIKNNCYENTNIYQKAYTLSLNLDSVSLKDFIIDVIDEFDFDYNLIKIGDSKNSQIKLSYIKELLNNFTSLGYTLDDFIKYLDDIMEKEYEIKLSENKEASDTVKLMTIHGSKGLEFHICYFPGLYNEFNMREVNDAILYSDQLGIITPYLDQDVKHTIYKDIYKYNYYKDDISERIRLFYVSLTRAKEKIIFLLDGDNLSDLKLNDCVKSTYRSFKDILISLGNIIAKYVRKIDLNNIEITKDYNVVKNNNYHTLINTNDKINDEPFSLDCKEISSQKFSKNAYNIFTKEEKDNMAFGLKVHSILEAIDFKNPKLDEYILEPYMLNKIEAFLKLDVLKNISDAKIYKEYEFMYQADNIYHGIIDLMLVYNDHVDIIDYKLKNITDEAYKEQLNGYKKYIENKLNKKTNIYLYSIIDETILNLGE